MASIGDRGELVGGPPWILGHRGSPREAPENTLVSLRRALDLGLDGVEYDLHACGSGEAVLLHDPILDRTTDAQGPVAERTLVELHGVDAGGWFGKRFAGEPVPLLAEALELPGDDSGSPPLHMIELKERGLVDHVARRVEEYADRIQVRVASFDRSICLEARDAGLPAMLLAEHAEQEDQRFVRRERLAAYGVGPRGWRRAAGALDWPCERWGWSVDEPEDLLLACRLPLFAFNTNEPLRALATRALVHLAPEDEGPYPVSVPSLPVVPGSLPDTEGEWCGAWPIEARVRNPFPFPCVIAAKVLVRRGAFEARGLPAGGSLEPGEQALIPFTLTGGSWSPGGDPDLVVAFGWEAGPGREAGRLSLDAPLHRRRSLRLDGEALRLEMLTERPGQPHASMRARRRGSFLVCEVEGPGGLRDVRAGVHLDGASRWGSHGVRIPIPGDLARRVGGVPFSCGFAGRDERGRLLFRRWAGGLPDALVHGAPGVLFSGTG